MWLVVNGDGSFRLFGYFCYPRRSYFHETKVDTSRWIEDKEDIHFSGYKHPEIPTGKIIKRWAYSELDYNTLSIDINEGEPIKKESLSKELQKRTWKDEPIEI